MTFQRSRSALSSMHLFFKADIVVFCEGGPSRSISEALAQSLDGRTLDAVYWTNVVCLLAIDKIYHLKSVGNKETLLTIAEYISISDCKTVTVCLDADYDVHLNRSVKNERVAYTSGYSWESDVLHREVVLRILTHLVGPPPESLINELNQAIDELERQLVRWCEIDVSLRAKAKRCVFLTRKASQRSGYGASAWPQVSLFAGSMSDCNWISKISQTNSYCPGDRGSPNCLRKAN